MRQSNPFGAGEMSDSAGPRRVRAGLQLRHGGHLVHGQPVGARRPHVVQLRRVRRHVPATEHDGQARGRLVRLYRLFRHGDHRQKYKTQHEGETGSTSAHTPL